MKISGNLKIEASKEEDKEKIIKSGLSILENNTLLTLSTFDKENNQPCSSTAYYVYDDEFNLYFWTDPYTLHSRNIKSNPNVAINIFDSTQKWGSLLKGVQLFGSARVVNAKELILGGGLYLKRFPGVTKYIKKVLDFHSKKYQSKMYKISISKVKVFDEAAFGKEEFRELVIERDN